MAIDMKIEEVKKKYKNEFKQSFITYLREVMLMAYWA